MRNSKTHRGPRDEIASALWFSVKEGRMHKQNAIDALTFLDHLAKEAKSSTWNEGQSPESFFSSLEA